MMNMKILLVNKFWYERGGAEKVVLLTKEFLEKAGHQVEIFGMNHPSNIISNKYFVDFVDYNNLSFLQKIKHGFKSIYNFQAARNFEKLLKNFQPDVVHFHNIFYQLSGSIIDVAKRMDIKTVMTLHDYKFISPNYNLFHHGKIDESCIGGKYYRCLLNNCLENYQESFLATIESYFVKIKNYKQLINKFISPSHYLRGKFVQAGFLASSIVCIPNPLPDNVFELIGSDEQFVLYFGRLSKEKGVENLLSAAKILGNIKFKIVGDGPDRELIEKIVKDQNLLNVELIGWQSREATNDLVKKSRIVVLPSVWYENAPMSLLEAKVRGKIVIASNLGGISELLPEDLLVDAGDATMLAQKIEQWFNCSQDVYSKKAKSLYEDVFAQNNSKSYLEKLLAIYTSLKDEK